MIERFDEGSPQMIIGIRQDQNIFTQSFLMKLQKLEKELLALEGVVSANSVASLRNPVKGVVRVKEKPFIRVESPEYYTIDTIAFFQYPDVYPKFVSSDRRSVCVFVSLEENLPQGFAENITALTNRFGLDQCYFYGLQVVENSYRESLESDIIIISVVACIMVISILWIAYGSLRLVLIAGVFIAIADLLVLAVLQISGATLNVLTVTVPAIVAVVSMSDLIHVANRFIKEEYSTDFSARIKNTYAGLQKSLFLTSFTTAMGFLTLLFTDVLPFVHFGIASSAGIGIAYLLTIYLLPMLLRFLPPKARIRRCQPGDKIPIYIKNRTGLLLTIAGCCTALMLYYGAQVRLNTYLYDDLDADDPLSQSLTFFENNFFGIRDLEFIVKVADGHAAYDPEVVRKLEPLQEYLEKNYGAGNVYSLLTLIKRYNRVYYGGKPEKFEVPPHPVALKKTLTFLQEEKQNALVGGLISEEAVLMRIFVKTEDKGSKVAENQRKALRLLLDQIAGEGLMQFKIAGRPYFIDRQNEEITIYLLKSLVVALIIVFLIILAVYRSWRLAFISLIVNLLPMVVMLCLMYWLDITLKKSTAVVFTIAFGIAVDDTIHFISSLQYSLSLKLSVREAVIATWKTTGRAILITSLVLVGGFGSFIFSDFQSTFLTGSLISIALLTAVLADLLILPALLFHFLPERPKKE
ncbi:MAG: efflux RND transporter permease subunit [Cyclobacteriaceae bacterium]